MRDLVLTDTRAAVRAIALGSISVLSLVLGVFLLRVCYLIWLSPYELVADEGQYWDWSRRLHLSYYSKGPGVASAIAASTRGFGHHEWAIRLPAAVAGAVAAFALAQLAAQSLGKGSEHESRRVALAVTVLFLSAPAFQLTALLMTIDAPYVACWVLAAWAAWCVYDDHRRGRTNWLPWLGLAFSLGVGFLFKYTIALLIPGLLAFAYLRRDRLDRSGRAVAQAAMAAAVLLIVVSPVVILNATHGGAGASHVLSLLNLPGGDTPRPAWRFDVSWLLGYVGSQLGAFGPMIGLMAIALWRLRDQEKLDSDTRDAYVFMLCCAVPTLLFFLLASVWAKVEGNWPIAAFCTLMVPAADVAVRHGSARRVSRWWLGSVLYGLLAASLIHAPLVAATLPVFRTYVPVHRFSGFSAYADRVSEQVARVESLSNERPIIIAASHNLAGLLAFYLPGHPLVFSAGSYAGLRRSAYDFFADTDLTQPQLRGRSALLCGGTPREWKTALTFDVVRFPDRPGECFTGIGYGGPRRPQSRQSE